MIIHIVNSAGGPVKKGMTGTAATALPSLCDDIQTGHRDNSVATGDIFLGHGRQVGGVSFKTAAGDNRPRSVEPR